ncbi:low-density lipoprotein receptor-like [Mytilus californianus]|uniref:low-density lipoprotein receptor-like n=1 Tax=Mytilus californianus TaxID=6549 RepID=UPI0022474DE1|nr:low-density lipoprotein receptor-like [Mytilus californianus]
MKVVLVFGLFLGTTLCCTEDQYECLDGQCIESSQKCDSHVDCSRGEDDMGCSGCESYKFKCGSENKCIIWPWVCDGMDDCDDGSDERGCTNICWNIDIYVHGSRRSITRSSADKVVSRGLDKRWEVKAARTNLYKKKNEAEKKTNNNKLEKLMLLLKGFDGK